MVFPVVGGNLLDTGYEISNSLRFNDGDSPALTRTMGAPTSTRKFTYVGWLKRSEINANQNSFLSWGGSTYATDFRYESGTDSLYFFFDDNASFYAKTKARYRDVSAWYQVVLAVDTTQATESNRVKLYVNGTQYGPALDGTDWTQHEIFGQNYDFPELANGQTMAIGKRNSSGSHFFDGYMSEIYFIDGQALDSSYFGETNDNGVWIPKEYDGTYGNNGFLLQFKQTGTSQNSSGIGADTSGNDNHFAVSNLAAIDVTTDTPTNNFATMNPNDNYYAGQTFSEGNCKIVTGTSPSTFNTSTIGVANGKWYWEVKIIDKATGSDQTSIGIQGGISPGATSQIGYNTRGIQLRSNGNTHTNGGNSTYMAAQDNNDIVMVAYDRDNNNLYFGANGQWGDGSGNTDEANPTSAKGISVADDDFVFAALGDMTGSDTCTYEINFGNPTFSISSGNADANGYGNFEYAPPSGYYAICTKNLAQYG